MLNIDYDQASGRVVMTDPATGKRESVTLPRMASGAAHVTLNQSLPDIASHRVCVAGDL